VEQEERQVFVESMQKLMVQREESVAVLQQILKEFSEKLFYAIEQVLAELVHQNISGVGKSRRIAHPAGGAREGLQVFIEDWSIIFVPMLGFARPNQSDEARIPPVQFKEQCARIAVFLTDDPQGRAFYDFILFQDRSWFAWGYGWPKQQADIEGTDFEALAYELIHSFIQDIFVTWNTREDTTLAMALDAKRRSYIYGLPGEDRLG